MTFLFAELTLPRHMPLSSAALGVFVLFLSSLWHVVTQGPKNWQCQSSNEHCQRQFWTIWGHHTYNLWDFEAKRSRKFTQISPTTLPLRFFAMLSVPPPPTHRMRRSWHCSASTVLWNPRRFSTGISYSVGAAFLKTIAAPPLFSKSWHEWITMFEKGDYSCSFQGSFELIWITAAVSLFF